MADILRIVDWEKTFENSRTRTIQNLQWVPIQNKHDSDGYTTILNHPDGAAHYACWVVIAQVASKCQPRGTLARAAHQGHDSASLSRVTRIPQELFEAAIPRLIDVGWLERISSDGTVLESGCQEGDTQPSGKCQEGVTEEKGREGKRREEKGREQKPPKSPKGDSLDSPADAYTKPFVAWWELYPRKVGKRRAAKAHEAAAKLVKAERCCDTSDAYKRLLDAVCAFANSDRGRGDKQFIPHPSRWLDEGRYDDDPEAWKESRSENRTPGPGQDVRRRGRVHERDYSRLDENRVPKAGGVQGTNDVDAQGNSSPPEPG